MADAATAARVEPHIGPTPVSAMASEELRAAVEPAGSAPASSEAPGSRSALDQLSRIEDKTARIEEKYARTEALMHRVADTTDAATARMGEVALQGDLVALRNEVMAVSKRVRGLPGLTALVFTAIVTALLTAAITAAVLKYVPGLLPR